MDVSVIVPIYNSQAYISKCLEALLAQTYKLESYEVIVVDDGSTDKTADIIKNYPVKYIYQKNQGPATARNRGVKEAKGDIILFTDSDCVPLSNWIEEMVRPFKSPDIAAVKGAYLTNQKEVIARLAQVEFEERFEMLKKAESIDMVDTYSAGFRKAIFLQMGGFDKTFPVANNEDTDLSYRMSKHGFKMVFNPDAIVHHLKHPDSIKKYARLKFWRGYWRMVVYKRFPDKMLKDSYTPQTLKLQILMLFLVMVFIPVAVIFPGFGRYLLCVTVLIFTLLLLPFIMLAIRKDPPVAVFAPFFLTMRAASLGAGMLWGILISKKI
ncbi:MAG: glycosyltransferase [Deltaproteobacteria bacterium]|nr:glycosyltransferase [Deltaproteobacteria bacterium]